MSRIERTPIGVGRLEDDQVADAAAGHLGGGPLEAPVRCGGEHPLAHVVGDPLDVGVLAARRPRSAGRAR